MWILNCAVGTRVLTRVTWGEEFASIFGDKKKKENTIKRVRRELRG